MTRSQEIRRIFDYHRCDKGHRHGYEAVYASLEPAQVHRILEVGVNRGASVASWLDIFPEARIFALDTFERHRPEETPILYHPRVRFYAGDSRALKLHPQLLFDTIIDDGSHTPGDQAATFVNLWPHLAPGGRYFIEDVLPIDLMETLPLWFTRRSKEFNREAFTHLIMAIAKTAGRAAIRHDLRTGHHSDSYILEVRK